MSEELPGAQARPSRRRRILKRVAIGLALVLVVVAGGVLYEYKHLESNIHGIDVSKALGTTKRPTVVKVQGPTEPMNILVMGSDDRQGTNIGGQTPGLSDTAILLHLSADRKRAYGVSIPRDLMVYRPSCMSKNGKMRFPAGVYQFNAAYAVGGPVCTIRTVEDMTNVRIQHFVVVNFNGFKDMVNAVHGVTVCVPTEVNDTVGHIHLPAGTYKVDGQQALDYVRVRHDLGAPTGDIGRMKRQQAFISAMIAKVVSAGTLANPVRLFNFLDAATKSLTTDTGFAHLSELVSLGSSLKDIGLDRIKFVTVPNQPWPEDNNRLELAPQAAGLWKRIRNDRPLGPYASDAMSPGAKQPGQKGSGGSGSGGSGSGGSGSSDAAKQEAQEAGLCA